MKIFHTADWHLGKLVQGVYMTEDQRIVLRQFVADIRDERPDVVIISGDLYDRAVPPTEAVQLLNQILDEIVLELNIPVIAIAGNHDSPSRLHFGSKMMQDRGFYICGQLVKDAEPVVLNDQFGEVHFHLVPYSDPSVVAHIFEDPTIQSHEAAAKKVIENMKLKKDARHVYIGHAFVTPYGEPEENTSESERPLSIGGAEHVDAGLFEIFHYTALGHLHQAHFVRQKTIRYAGSPLKYSISEEHHQKGYLVIQLDGTGKVEVEKRPLIPIRDMRTIEGKMADLLTLAPNEDYVFVRLLDETPVLSPMEKLRAVFPNAMHVERKQMWGRRTDHIGGKRIRKTLDDIELFRNFYEEIKGIQASNETETIFTTVLDELLKKANETHNTTVKQS